jgi:hypothetical protein
MRFGGGKILLTVSGIEPQIVGRATPSLNTMPPELSRPLVHRKLTFIAICFNDVPWTLRWLHTCNVTAYRNAVTLQVTDTIRSYGLNFHSVPHGVTVSCERYTMGFPVCYGSQKHQTRGADGGYVSLCTSRPAQAVTVSSLWCDGQIPTAHRTCP